MGAGFATSSIAFGPLSDVAEQATRSAAASAGAQLYRSNFGISPILTLFGWIFASGALSHFLRTRTAHDRASIFVYSFLDGKNARYARMLTDRDKLDHMKDPEEYVRAAVSGWTRWAAGCAALLFAVAAYTYDRELRTYAVYTDEGFFARPLLPWERARSMRWSEAIAVATGCNHTTGRGASDDLIYEVVFNDGSQRLEHATPVSGTWLDRVEVIDAALDRHGVKRRRWQWFNRDPLHPDCMSANRMRYGEAWPRAERLLRVDVSPTENALTE
jgi:hypothetical protein